MVYIFLLSTEFSRLMIDRWCLLTRLLEVEGHLNIFSRRFDFRLLVLRLKIFILNLLLPFEFLRLLLLFDLALSHNMSVFSLRAYFLVGAVLVEALAVTCFSVRHMPIPQLSRI